MSTNQATQLWSFWQNACCHAELICHQASPSCSRMLYSGNMFDGGPLQAFADYCLWALPCGVFGSEQVSLRVDTHMCVQESLSQKCRHPNVHSIAAKTCTGSVGDVVSLTVSDCAILNKMTWAECCEVWEITRVAVMPASPPAASLADKLSSPFSFWKRFFSTS